MRQTIKDQKFERRKRKREKGKRRSAYQQSTATGKVKTPGVVVGRLETYASRASIQPILSDLKFDVHVSNARGYKDDDIVLAGVVRGDRGEYRGKIQRKISGSSTAELAANVALTALQRPVQWTNAIHELRFPTEVSAEDRENRTDLRTLPFVTIDGESARDFDDAVLVQAQEKGEVRLLVAIADVSHYVLPDTPLDRAARKRGCSIYLPDRVIPMLPKELSNGICSLVPNEDRLAMICDMVVDQEGVLLGAEFYEAVIRSHARLTYSEVDAFIQGKSINQSEPVRRSLQSLRDLCKKLLRQRSDRGALDFDIPQVQIPLTQGEPMLPKLVERNFAHLMIEEAMILANRAVAEYLEERDIPLFRVHEPPKAEAMLRLRQTLADQKVELPSRITGPKALKDAVAQLKLSKENARFWHLQVIQSMQLAMYSSSNYGHFGLALTHYLHFTSPIRRYPDLYTHRVLKNALRNGRAATDADAIEQLARVQSEHERAAEQVTRQVEKWLLCELLQSHLGEFVSGTITGVTNFGLFVELDKYFASGLLHVSNLGFEYFELEGNRLVGELSRTSLNLGQRLRVQIVAVDPVLGRVDLRWDDKDREAAYRRTNKKAGR